MSAKKRHVVELKPTKYESQILEGAHIHLPYPYVKLEEECILPRGSDRVYWEMFVERLCKHAGGEIRDKLTAFIEVSERKDDAGELTKDMLNLTREGHWGVRSYLNEHQAARNVIIEAVNAKWGKTTDCDFEFLGLYIGGILDAHVENEVSE